MNPYKILQIDRKASLEEIKKAYRKRARETHPDKSNGSAEAFHAVTEAYDALTKSKKEPHKAPKQRNTANAPFYTRTYPQYREYSRSTRAGHTRSRAQNTDPQPQDFVRAFDTLSNIFDALDKKISETEARMAKAHSEFHKQYPFYKPWKAFDNFRERQRARFFLTLEFNQNTFGTIHHSGHYRTRIEVLKKDASFIAEELDRSYTSVPGQLRADFLEHLGYSFTVATMIDQIFDDRINVYAGRKQSLEHPFQVLPAIANIFTGVRFS